MAQLYEVLFYNGWQDLPAHYQAINEEMPDGH